MMNERKITSTLLNVYKDYLIRDEKSEATISKYLHDVRVFAEFAQDRPIDKNLVLEYKDMLGEAYSVSSANSMLAALNSFFRFMNWREAEVKRFKVQKQVYCKAENELTKDEYLRLVAAAEQKSKRLSLVIQTLCGLGMRVSELSYITVEAVECGEAVVSCKGKTRVIFIVSSLRKKLLKYEKKEGISQGVIFITRSGNPLDRSNIWREMKMICKDACVRETKVFPHNLRHLFARTFYTMEKDIAKLADVLGHSNINTTRIYIVTSGAEHLRQLEKMHLIPLEENFTT